VKNGVPFHIALGQWSDAPQPIKLDRLERMAMAITMSEHEGAHFDFHTMSWRKPETP
jgi:hypothetical protein